ncbi:ABC transporter permease [Francisella adeliensis]|uniref:ABC transporter permease subunit n=1 Tax=Francisella adeliensis TaxID=2007306 RepID=A0A2Z4XZB7_9GAMM|nr:ABC transporter permease subunit [Francisella adeliensis]AXA34104.1 putrescine ABC transporter permease PotH [Francisella adeliensis]MBK2085272.1 ABC transporter permease subunit [Francisella adeliensis]MBK2095960.1 ABC transporter permease subunit [Francisella adeliensis]QIW12346.1 ABC transporter permease subunit [Francisella adeliensis]QIW14220.1 ABC transporter permease subunit [Francisella adeliensis]
MQNLQKSFRHTLIYLVPMVWFLVFLLIPFIFVIGISFTLPADGTPPVTHIFDYSDSTIHFTLYLRNYLELIHYNIIFIALFNSLKIAIVTTILCILIGYPMALALSRAEKKTQLFFLILIVIPYWTSFLLRTYAWVTLLGNHTFNEFLMSLGLPSMALLYNDFSMYLGMVYCYLPFLVLPLYSTLIKIDPTLYEAAEDLGSKPINSFFKITLPLSMPGLIAGSLLIFIPAVGEVVVPQIMGGMNSLMIGNIIWEEFFTSNNWGMAAAISVALIAILALPILWMQRIQVKKTFI